LLAKALLRMVAKLPNSSYFDPAQTIDIVKRMGLFLSIAANFGQNDYDKFAFGVNGFVHELSLLMYIGLQLKKPLVSYQEFIMHSRATVVAMFGLAENDLCQSFSVSAMPTNGGMRAFNEAFKLAEEMLQNFGIYDPEIVIDETNIYFEIPELMPFHKNGFIKLSEFVKVPARFANIYTYSSGSIAQANDTESAGVNINEFIRKNILRGYAAPNKCIFILVDATTGFYENLKLDPDILNLVKLNYLIIMTFISRQKFGLLHTDQAQYGETFVLCGSPYKNWLANFETESNNFLMRSLDRQVGAYIRICSGSILEQIKERHFINGGFFRGSHFASNHLGNNSTAYPKKNYFLVATNFPIQLFDIFPLRDSFGHFNSVTGSIGNSMRISFGASDLVDIRILISRSFFGCPGLVSNQTLLALLGDISKEMKIGEMGVSTAKHFSKVLVDMKKLDTGKLNLEDAIILMIIFCEVINRKMYQNLTTMNDYKLVFCIGRLLSWEMPELVNRSEWKFLMQFFYCNPLRFEG
jgi:hypothetical protein